MMMMMMMMMMKFSCNLQICQLVTAGLDVFLRWQNVIIYF